MWGQDNEEMRTVQIEDATYELKSVANPRLHLVDRRTCTSVTVKLLLAGKEPAAGEDPVRVPVSGRRRSARKKHNSVSEQGQIVACRGGACNFQSHWPECSRVKEPVVIQEVRSRAEQLGDFRSYVLDHMPLVDSWEERARTSTGTIHEVFNRSSEWSGVQVLMVSLELVELFGLEDSAKLLTAFWEAVRCMSRKLISVFRLSINGYDCGYQYSALLLILYIAYMCNP